MCLRKLNYFCVMWKIKFEISIGHFVQIKRCFTDLFKLIFPHSKIEKGLIATESIKIDDNSTFKEPHFSF